MKILVGEISSYKSIAIVKYLNKNYKNNDLYTYDNQKFTNIIKTKYSDSKKHYVLSNCSTVEYIKSLAQLVKELGIDLFLPVHSEYISSILKQKQKFGSSLFYLGDYSTYQKLHEKDTLQSIAKNLGIDIPKNYNDIESAEAPFVAKPNQGSSSKGVQYFQKSDDKKLFDKNSNHYIFQEYIKGFGCGYSVYAKDGEILVDYGHRRLAEYPIKGGSSVYRTGFYVKEMKEVASKILRDVGWSGFAMFEFKFTDKGRLVLIEVNPRIWGSFNQGLQNGANYLDPILGEKKIKNSSKKSYNTYLSPQIYLVLIQYALNMNFLPAKRFFLNINNNKADISIVRDLRGWLSVIFRSVL